MRHSFQHLIPINYFAIDVIICLQKSCVLAAALSAVIPCNTELLATDEVKKDALVTAQNDTFNKTSVIQPTVTGMNDYWAPAQNFAKAIVNGEITADNAAAKTQDFYKQINTSIAK